MALRAHDDDDADAGAGGFGASEIPRGIFAGFIRDELNRLACP